MTEPDVTTLLAGLAQRPAAPPPPWARMPFYQRLRMTARAAVMAGGLAGTERRGLIARAMPELPLLRHFIPPGCLAVDVGANIGVVASEIARHAAHVLAFEPNPMPYFVLRNLRKPNFVPVWAALGTMTGTVELVVPCDRRGPSSNGGHLRDARDYADTVTYQVPGMTLDSLQLGALGFLKVDVEGHEPAVLDGGAETLRRCRPSIMIEHEISHAGDAFGDVFARLAALDYDGCFFERGTLRHLSNFDPVRHQSAGTRKSNGTYVSNFFFLPRKQTPNFQGIRMPAR